MSTPSLLRTVRRSHQLMQRSMSTIKPWKHPVVEANGDYDQDVFLEDRSKPLFQFQSKLPNLPVPALQETVDRFLPTALPLAETKEEEESLLQACRDFPDQAKELQNRLLERADKSTSWLQVWWNQMCYLQIRDPVVINVSYFFNLPDDPTLEIGGDEAKSSSRQVKRGAALLKAAWEYRNTVCSGDLPQEKIGKQQTPLCSAGFKYLFHSCRVPQPFQDSCRLYDPSVYTHAIVACRGHFFSLPLVDENGREYSLSAIERALSECISQAEETQPVELGLLTTSNRDVCAHSRSELIQIGGKAMEDALTELESGMLMLCLDSDAVHSKQQCARLYLHGNGSSNRWYDKNVQLVVSSNGKLGYVGEHAMMDGMPAVGVSQHLLKRTYGSLSSEQETALSTTPPVHNIFQPVLGNLDTSSLAKVHGMVDKARNDFHHLVDSNDLHLEFFQGYGTDFIKASGFSPDAYIQIAIQLATYRLFGKQAATYESTQVRPFVFGRTETTRTVSPASNAFVKKMGLHPLGDNDKAETRTMKLSLLKEATESHVKYIRLASQAQGVDRHLMGLSLSAKEGEELPDLLTHPLHVRSKTWRVSTSTLPTTSPGFGPVCDTGVGIGYDITATSCTFSVTSLKQHGYTEPLCHYLEEALLEMKEMIELDGASRSKL